MKRFFWQPVVAATVAIVASSSAIAGEQPLYQPVPEWVDEVDISDVLAKGASSSDALVSVDQNVKLEGGQGWIYRDLVLRASSSEVLSQIGRLQGAWHPDLGDFIVHEVHIIRDGEVIDVLASGNKFEILRREAGLEQLQVDGILTAFMQLEGLRIGDLVRMKASTTILDPALEGHVQFTDALLAEPVRAQFGRFQLIWPKSDDIQWRVTGKDAEHALERRDDYQVLNINVPIPKQPENAPDAPARYANLSMVEATSFKDWKSVSQTAAKLYQTADLITEGSELDREVQRIAASSDDPLQRTAAALRLVQDKVRYLFNGLNGGNYTPQSPEETWNLRYGDCKAKTLLLLTLLDRLGIDARAALVHSTLADAIPDRLPSFGTFDHIIVKASIDGRTYWLDGTKTGDRLADIGDTPPFRYALPLDLAGAELESIPLLPMSRPIENISIAIDASAGINFPAPYDISIVLRGPAVDQLSTIKNTVSVEQYEELLQSFIMRYTGDQASVTRSEAVLDGEAGTASITGSGLATMSWSFADNRRRYSVDNYIGNTKLLRNRTKTEWKEIPYAMSYPGYYVRNFEMILPAAGKGFEFQGLAEVSDVIAGYEQARKTSLDDGKVTVSEYWRTARWEVPADEVKAERAKLLKFQSPKLRILTPEDYPPAWLETRQAAESNGFAEIIAAYEADIALHPDKSRPYENFAGFYQGTYQYRKAAEQLLLALEQEENAKTYVQLASLYATVEDKRALESAKRALELDPSSVRALAAVTEILAMDGQIDEALEVLDAARGNGIEPDDITHAESEVLMQDGQYEEAIAIMDELISSKPNDHKLLNNRCWNKGRAKLYLESALKDCTKAIQLSRSPSAILDSRALVHFQLGQYDEALLDLDTALDISPSLPAALYLRGLVHARMGNDQKSEADISAAEFIVPTIAKEYAKFGIMIR
ncbi:Tetratricopeptide (TPR) repeat [Parasphingorhabdus marina DSM 22363]|uniref:Tetratricopeptide (TPR) repeat n=1 Tax=Parasphingorhabdus marina DSM 22363 TaxID=1123272 RepID=A0A1N6FCS9_9SPHN|nr:tetratricopeptide repeat protein [Parasphingorhabdus marina]SIN93093.1 Tetratricopeptide (TPR) repeat [Parasphingorhabdus marina DSM 22363]